MSLCRSCFAARSRRYGEVGMSVITRTVVGFCASLAFAATAFCYAAQAQPGTGPDAASGASRPLTPDAVNDPALADAVGPKARGAAVLRAQVLLDRARFSPGEIDAVYGTNLQKAIAGFQKNNDLDATGIVDAATWAALNRDTAPILHSYRITEADAAGPFSPIPRDMMAKSKLPALSHSSLPEKVGEMFHASPKLLQRLNPGKALAHAGEEVIVPNVGGTAPLAKAARVIVRKSDSTVSLIDDNGRVMAQYPASIGSEMDPLPIGTWKINGVARNPLFHYNPKLFWDADPTHAKAKIAPVPTIRSASCGSTCRSSITGCMARRSRRRSAGSSRMAACA